MTVRPYDLPEFVRKRAQEKGAIVPVVISEEYVGQRATGWNWRGSSWEDGCDYWTYESRGTVVADTKGMTLTRRVPLRRKGLKKRRQTRRCEYVAPGRTSGRCSRSPLREIPYCRTHLLALVDAEARRRVFERDADTCQRCGGPGRDWSHWPSRSYRGTRWLLDGAVVHCSACHKWLTDRPLEHEAWVRSHFGDERVDELRRIALEFASGRAKVDMIGTARAFGLLDHLG